MIYFDNAATTFPKPRAVLRAMNTCMRKAGGNPGRSAHPMALAAAETIYETRCRVADFFGCARAENVVFTKNTTEALNLVLQGLAVPNAHFLITDLEHNSVLRPLEMLRRTRGVRYDTVGALCDDDELLSRIEAGIRAETVAVVTTHASNICPRVLPIGRIGALCRDKHVLYIVDGAQSAGIYEISLPRDGVSVLCAPGHKGLYGPQGSGFALFADDFDFERLQPLLFGGNGKASAELIMGHEPPESYEAGTAATPNIAGLDAGIRFVQELGRENIERKESELFRYAKSRLQERARVRLFGPETDRGSLLLLGFEGRSPTEVASLLGEMEICVRAGLHCAPTAHRALGTGGDALRISFSVFNTVSEVDRLSEALDRIGV